jgi:hypothetical protein
LINFEEADAEIRGGQAFRVIEANERWFLSEAERGERDLAVLRLLGLFDRPATHKCLKALRQKPEISGFNDRLVQLTDSQWQLSLTRLSRASLW